MIFPAAIYSYLSTTEEEGAGPYSQPLTSYDSGPDPDGTTDATNMRREMAGNSRPISKFLLEATLSLRGFIEEHHIIDLLKEWFWNLVVPILTALLVGTLSLRLLRWTNRRYLNPPTAREWHYEAMVALEQPYSLGQNSRSKKKAEKQAEELLWKALERDPSYAPAMLSLAALYIYRQGQAKAALKLLDSLVKSNEWDKTGTGVGYNPQAVRASIEALKQDGQALLEGHENMLQVTLAETEFLSVLSVPNPHIKQ